MRRLVDVRAKPSVHDVIHDDGGRRAEQRRQRARKHQAAVTREGCEDGRAGHAFAVGVVQRVQRKREREAERAGGNGDREMLQRRKRRRASLARDELGAELEQRDGERLCGDALQAAQRERSEGCEALCGEETD